MTALVNFSKDKVGGVVVGTNVSTLTCYNGINNPDDIVLIHVFATNTGGAQPAVPTFADNFNLVWHQVASVAYDATNGSRHSVYWARCPHKGRLIVTVTLNNGSNVSSAGVAMVGMIGGHVTAIQDLNANSLKTESHTASATSSISGFSTTSPDTIIYSFYGSRTVSSPGAITSFTNQYGQNSTVELRCDLEQVTSAQSSISIAYASATTTGSMIAFAIRPRTVARKQIRFIQGFDHYASAGSTGDTTGGAANGALAGEKTAQTNSLGGSRSLVTGRDGVGQAIRCNGNASIGAQMRFNSTVSNFYVTGGGQDGVAGDSILDGQHIYIGCNIKLNSSQPVGTPSGIQSTIKLGSTVRLIIAWDMSTAQWKLYKGTTVSGGTLLASGTPHVNPQGQWVWIEFHLWRDGTNGKFEMWQEGGTVTTSGHYGPWYTGTVYPLPDSYGITENYALEKVIDYTGDTSVATIGSIAEIAFNGSDNGTNPFSNDYDDIVFSTGDRMREPCYVKTFHPTADVATSGWAPSTGTDHFAVVDETLDDRTDYLTCSSGNPSDELGTFGALPYTPNKVYAVQHVASHRKISGSSNAILRTQVKSGGVAVPGHYLGISTTLDQTSLMCASYDPNTRSSWSAAAAVAASMIADIPTVNGSGTAQSLSTTEVRAYQWSREVLMSIQTGAGLGGDEDEANVNQTPSGFTGLEGKYNTGMHPIAVGMKAVEANLHPIEIGICQ